MCDHGNAPAECARVRAVAPSVERLLQVITQEQMIEFSYCVGHWIYQFSLSSQVSPQSGQVKFGQRRFAWTQGSHGVLRIRE